MTENARLEQRAVRSEDPSLSPEANRILTEELRRRIGSDVVVVPADRPHAEQASHGGRPALVRVVEENMIAFTLGFFAAIVFGAVVSLMTGSWWLLGVAVLVDVLGTVVVTAVMVGLAGETEHLPPEVTARLEDEGVGDPDRVFTALVEEYTTTQTPQPGRPVGP